MRRERALALRQPRAPHQEVARSSGHRAGPWHFLPHPSFSISDRCPQFSVHSSENAPKTLERPYSTRLSHTSLKDVFQHMPTPSPGACPGRSGLCGVRRVDTGCAACGRLLTAGGWEEKGRCQGLWLPWAWWQALSSKSALAPSPSEFSPLSRHDLISLSRVSGPLALLHPSCACGSWLPQLTKQLSTSSPLLRLVLLCQGPCPCSLAPCPPLQEA